jgi:phage terminase small subunit
MTLKRKKIKPTIKLSKKVKRKAANIIKDLNDKQKAFCREYVSNGFNTTRAYQIVYNKSEQVSASCGYKLLRNAYVKEYIKYLNDNWQETVGLNQIRIALEVMKIGFSSFENINDTWITKKDFENLPKEVKDCIKSIATQTKTIHDKESDLDIDIDYVKVELYDKLKALEILNKMAGYNAPDKSVIDFPKGVPIATVTAIAFRTDQER